MKFRKIIKGATNPRGQEYKVLCPFHQDRTEGSFSINGNTGLYNCYSCGAKGNIYGYVKQVYPEFENSKNREIANFVNQIEGYEAIPLQQFNRYNGEVETIVNSDFELLMQNISFRKSVFVENPYLLKKFAKDELSLLADKLDNKDNIYFLNEGLQNYNFSYFSKDKEKSVNLGISKLDLIVRMQDNFIQVIKPDSSKQFALGMKSYLLIEKNEENPYIIAEGVATALTYLLLDFNVIIAFAKSNVESVIREYKSKGLLHKLFVSVDYDIGESKENYNLARDSKTKISIKDEEKYNKDKNNLIKLGAQVITFEEQGKKANKKGYDANDFLYSFGKNALQQHLENEFKKYSHKTYLEGSGIRVYINSKIEYLVIYNNKIYECGTLKKAIQSIAGCLTWYKSPTSKSLYGLIEDFITHNCKHYDRLGYSPARNFLEEYQHNGKNIINSYKDDGFLKLPLHFLEEGKFPRIKEIIDNNVENHFNWFCNFLANKIQDPENKPHLGIIIFSNGFGGSGKSTLAKILHYIFGENCVPEVSQKSLKGNYNDFLFNNLLWCAEEISAYDNGNILQDIKTSLTSTTMQRRKRYADDVIMENYGNGIILSDKGIPILLEDNENRRFVVFESKDKINSSYGRDISLKEASIMKEIKAFTRYLIDFKIYPVENIETETKKKLIRASQTHELAMQDEFLDFIISDTLQSSWRTKGNEIYIPYYFIDNFLVNKARNNKTKKQTIASFCKELESKIEIRIEKKNLLQSDNTTYKTTNCFVITKDSITELKNSIKAEKVD